MRPDYMPVPSLRDSHLREIRTRHLRAGLRTLVRKNVAVTNGRFSYSKIRVEIRTWLLTLAFAGDLNPALMCRATYLARRTLSQWTVISFEFQNGSQTKTQDPSLSSG